MHSLVVWRSGNDVGHISKVAVRWAQPVVEWMTVPVVRENRPHTSTQPGHPSIGKCNECQQRAVMLCGYGVEAGIHHDWWKVKLQKNTCHT